MTIKLVVFDVDGTLTRHSSIWWRLHEHFGTEDEGRAYYNQYFAGEITYDEWADLDAGLWTGKSVEAVLDVVRNSELVPGAIETISTLRDHGIHLAILSGGLDILANDIASRLGIDYVLTNLLEHSNGVLTGKVENLVGWGDKAKEILQICEHFGVSLGETAFIGDGQNDVGVFSVVGLPIAFMPEDKEVAEAAQIVIESNDLRLIIPHII
ncbi:MAG: HAD family phosphatase [Candidatus Thorarchaeota archaeon]